LFCRQKYKERGPFHIYIITYETSLENQKDCEIEIKPPDEMRSILETAESVSHLIYHIEGKRRKHEVVCPRYTFAGGGFVVVIPWFLVPGRPYPVQVYLYACGLYSANPAMGQRAAAKATCDEFNLEKFSHSTVSRSFRGLEARHKQELERRFGEELTLCGAVNASLVAAGAKSEPKGREAQNTAGRFPTVADTARRREGMAAFLRGFLDDCKKASIEAAARLFVESWNKKARRLLL